MTRKSSPGCVATITAMMLLESFLVPAHGRILPAVASTAVARIVVVVFPALPVMPTKVTFYSRRRCKAARPGSRRDRILHPPGTRSAAARREERIASPLLHLFKSLRSAPVNCMTAELSATDRQAQ